MRTLSFFYSPVSRGYIRKVSVHLVQKYFLVITVLIVSLAVNKKKESDEKISKRDSNKTETRQCYF